MLINGPVLQYTPASSTSYGSFSASVRAVDARGATSAASTISWTINGPGGSPGLTMGSLVPAGMHELNTPAYPWAADYGNTVISVAPGGHADYHARLAGHDFEQEPIHFAWASSRPAPPPGAALDPNTGEVRWTVSDADIGAHTFYAWIYDQRTTPNASINISFQWTVVVQAATDNLPPVVTSTPVTVVPADTDYAYRVTATDPDSSTLTYKLWSGPSTMSLSPSGLLTWHPSSTDIGGFSVVLSVTDEQNNATSQVFDLTVGSSDLNITSTPPLSALVGQKYSYLPVLQDNSVPQTAVTRRQGEGSW